MLNIAIIETIVEIMIIPYQINEYKILNDFYILRCENVQNLNLHKCMSIKVFKMYDDCFDIMSDY